MSHPLADPCLKIKRAKRQLSEINRIFDEWLALDPYKLIRQPDLEDWYVFTVSITARPPDEMGAVVGEFAYNLRTALNQIVWQLSLLSTPTPDSRSTEFPTFWALRESAINERLQHVTDPDAQAIIRGLQPYHRGDDAKADLLWVLHTLNGVDKYQIVHDIGMLMRNVFIIGDHAMALDVTFRRLNDQTPVHIPKIPLPPEADFQVQFAAGIALADIGPTGFTTRETLQALYDYVGGIVLSFERFF